MIGTSNNRRISTIAIWIAAMPTNEWSMLSKVVLSIDVTIDVLEIYLNGIKESQMLQRIPNQKLNQSVHKCSSLPFAPSNPNESTAAKLPGSGITSVHTFNRLPSLHLKIHGSQSLHEHDCFCQKLWMWIAIGKFLVFYNASSDYFIIIISFTKIRFNWLALEH